MNAAKLTRSSSLRLLRDALNQLTFTWVRPRCQRPGHTAVCRRYRSAAIFFLLGWGSWLGTPVKAGSNPDARRCGRGDALRCKPVISA